MLLQRESAVFVLPHQALDGTGREVQHPCKERLGLRFRQQEVKADICAEVRILDDPVKGCNFKFNPFIPAIGTGQVDIRPDALHGAPGGVQRDLRPVGIGPHQAARSQQDSAEIPRHHAGHVEDPLPLQHLQHWHSGSAARFSVIGKTGRAVPDDIGVDVVGRVPVFFPHLLQPSQRFLLGLGAEDMPDKPGAPLDEFGIGIPGRHQIFLHRSGSFTNLR